MSADRLCTDCGERPATPLGTLCPRCRTRAWQAQNRPRLEHYRKVGRASAQRRAARKTVLSVYEAAALRGVTTGAIYGAIRRRRLTPIQTDPIRLDRAAVERLHFKPGLTVALLKRQEAC